MTTLTSPHDLLAAVPFLIGYHPTDSIVIVALKNESVGMAMRVDFPTVEGLQDLEVQLVAHLEREGADAALIVAYQPAGSSQGEEILAQLASALFRADIEVRESLLIFGSRWRSLLCCDINCCPLEGRELPEISTSRIAAEQVALGHPMPYVDESELGQSISSLPLSSDAQFMASVRSFLVDQNDPDIQQIRRDGAVAVIDLASRFIAGSLGKDIGDDQEICARVIGRLSDIQVRDFALGSHDQGTQDLYWSMWRYLLRIAPVGCVAPVATLLAAISYENGDGALARRSLERAREDDPAYSLTILLARVFSAGWPSESFAAMRKELHPKVCAGIFEGAPHSINEEVTG